MKMRHGKIVFCLLILGISACSPIETPTYIAQTPIPAAVEATATAEPTPAQVTQASPVEWVGAVVFYSNMEGNPDIYFMSTSGGDPVRLTNDPAFDDSPALSPDGSRVVFLSARDDPEPTFPNLKYEIYLVDSDGQNLRRLTETEVGEDHPAWSPDGEKILFDADYDGDGFFEIYTLDINGENLTQLTENAANDQFADWSPDGSKIAFSSDRNGNWDIFVMDADGGNQLALTEGADWELFPAWSPDGSQIAYNGLVPNTGNTDVFVMNADGSDVLQLTDSPGFDENPAWSPDGTLIAFQTQRDGNFEIYIMNPDGSSQLPLLTLSSDELWPSWQMATP
jgi:TolB protein